MSRTDGENMSDEADNVIPVVLGGIGVAQNEQPHATDRN
jgi:hypothetical protein